MSGCNLQNRTGNSGRRIANQVAKEMARVMPDMVMQIQQNLKDICDFLIYIYPYNLFYYI